MSTKIYDMYKYQSSMFELVQWLHKFRRAYERAATREVSIMIGSCYKHYTLRDEDEKHVLWTDEGHFRYFELLDLLREQINYGLNEPMNIGASVAVYPYKGEIFVQFFGLNFGTREYSKWLRKHIDNNGKFELYEYWNNTDPPENINYDEWEARGKMFDDMFKKYSCFNSVGLVYELSNTETLLNICRHVAIWRERNKDEQELEFWGKNGKETGLSPKNS